MQEEKGRNNTAMLTVIAIATLLVAVVGATFAYFSTTTNNNADVTVTATTKAADLFTAAGTAAINLNVEASEMQKTEGNDNYSVTGATDTKANAITVTLKANSGEASCDYDVVYVPTTSYTATQSSLIEYGIIGTCSDSTNSFTRVNAAGAGSSLTDGASTVTGIMLKQNARIVNTANEGATQSETTQTWSFTGDYYNLGTVDQSAAAGSAFGGEIRVINVRCSNSND